MGTFIDLEDYLTDISDNIYRDCQELDEESAKENTKDRLRRMYNCIENGEF